MDAITPKNNTEDKSKNGVTREEAEEAVKTLIYSIGFLVGWPIIKSL